MQTRYVSLVLAISFLAGLVLTETAHAAAYPGNRCAAAKLRAAGGKCRARLGAWAAFAIGGGINVTKRDTALGNATNRLRNSWEKAERAAAKKSVDCVDMTLANDDAQTQIDDVVDGIYTDIISGLNLSTKDEAKCSAALLKAAGKMCSTYFAKEAAYLQKLAAGKTKRDNGRAKALAALTATVNKQLAGNCPTTATLTSISTAVDHLVADITDKIIVSPNVDDTQFTMISPTENPGIRYGKDTLHPVCSYGTPYHYFVKRGSVNKLLIYYQGGGACWDLATCVNIQTFDKDVDPSSWDNPNYLFTGFGDLNNPLNPFKDWNIVFVPYCTGDIHFGDSSPYYGLQEIKHKGWHNARTVEKWAREHFLAPDEIFITGSSAGAYGAFFNAPAHHDVWPDSRISVLGDAGNGVITSSFLQNEFSNWNFEAHLPPPNPGNSRGDRRRWRPGTVLPGRCPLLSEYGMGALLDGLRWRHGWSNGLLQRHVEPAERPRVAQLVACHLPVARCDGATGVRHGQRGTRQLSLLHRRRLDTHNVGVRQGLYRHHRQCADDRRLDQRDARSDDGLDECRVRHPGTLRHTVTWRPKTGDTAKPTLFAVRSGRHHHLPVGVQSVPDRASYIEDQREQEPRPGKAET